MCNNELVIMCLYAMLHLLLTNSKLENSIPVMSFDEDKMNNYYKKGLHIEHLTIHDSSAV